ncbi:MAG: hypothetical protein ACI4XR_05510 [Bacilli bacterium]
MKQSKYYLFLFMILFIIRNVFAECTYEDQAKLNSEAATIKAIYEEQTGKFDSSYTCNDGQSECEGYNYFKISILNLSEDFYIKVSEGKKTITTLTYNNVVDGIASFDVEDITETHTYKFDVYTSNKTNCKSSLNRSFYLTTPRYNEYYDFAFCQDTPDYYLCKKYVTFEKMDIMDFVNKYNEYIESKREEEKKDKNENFFQKLGDFIREYKTIFITGGVVIIVGVAGIIIVKQKRRKDII